MKEMKEIKLPINKKLFKRILAKLDYTRVPIDDNFVDGLFSAFTHFTLSNGITFYVEYGGETLGNFVTEHISNEYGATYWKGDMKAYYVDISEILIFKKKNGKITNVRWTLSKKQEKELLRRVKKLIYIDYD